MKRRSLGFKQLLAGIRASRSGKTASSGKESLNFHLTSPSAASRSKSKRNRFWQKALIASIGSLVLVLAASTDNIDIFARDARSEQQSTRLSEEELYREARAIAVKVLSSELLGSGVIIHSQANIYTVLTNAHVIGGVETPLSIETKDGKIYPAEVVKTANFGENDLQLLQFSGGDRSYSVAKLGASSSLRNGDRVFAAGFPFFLQEIRERENERIGQDLAIGTGHCVLQAASCSEGFFFRTGTIVEVLEKALEGGYQVGYTNEIEKGMSGGPLLNDAGELVGVNGKHAYPLWEAPEYYQDGSKPSPRLQEAIIRSSWAVPVELFRQLAPIFEDLS